MYTIGHVTFTHMQAGTFTCTRFFVLQVMLPSFMSLDVDGRVMRYDSLSKVISSG